MIKPTPPALEGEVLTTRLSRKSLQGRFLNSGRVGVDNPGERKQCMQRVGGGVEQGGGACVCCSGNTGVHSHQSPGKLALSQCSRLLDAVVMNMFCI